MNKLPRYALRFVGYASVVLAGLGLWYNGSSLFTTYPPDPDTPYFSHAFYVMSAICIGCYLTLLVIGVQLIRLNPSLLRLFIALMIFEVAYFFTVGLFWTTPGIGMSVAAASGVACGGLMFQFLPLFPLWGPLLVRWAKRNIEASPSDGEVPFFASEQIERPTDWLWAAVNFIVLFALTFVLISMAWNQFNRASFPPALISVAIPALLGTTSALSSVRGRRRRRRKEIERRHAARLNAGLCPRCEYSLKGLTMPRCPECGMEFPQSVLETGG